MSQEILLLGLAEFFGFLFFGLMLTVVGVIPTLLALLFGFYLAPRFMTLIARNMGFGHFLVCVSGSAGFALIRHAPWNHGVLAMLVTFGFFCLPMLIVGALQLIGRLFGYGFDLLDNVKDQRANSHWIAFAVTAVLSAVLMIPLLFGWV
jgi:hypothetical protein